jgi:hypothetical protein
MEGTPFDATTTERPLLVSGYLGVPNLQSAVILPQTGTPCKVMVLEAEWLSDGDADQPEADIVDPVRRRNREAASQGLDDQPP